MTPPPQRCPSCGTSLIPHRGRLLCERCGLSYAQPGQEAPAPPIEADRAVEDALRGRPAARASDPDALRSSAAGFLATARAQAGRGDLAGARASLEEALDDLRATRAHSRWERSTERDLGAILVELGRLEFEGGDRRPAMAHLDEGARVLHGRLGSTPDDLAGWELLWVENSSHYSDQMTVQY